MKLSNEIDNLKNRYREIFLKCVEDLKNSSTLEDVYEELCKKRALITETKKGCTCNGCGSCCKLACSEFSPEQLLEKAQNGDNFAKQFIETFIPYENMEEAKKIYPEYFDLLEKTPNEATYYYHCPRVTQDNRCPDYENRPQICKDFPDNPIGFLPLKCAFNYWKKEVVDTALEIKATFEILEFYKTQS